MTGTTPAINTLLWNLDILAALCLEAIVTLQAPTLAATLLGGSQLRHVEGYGCQMYGAESPVCDHSAAYLLNPWLGISSPRQALPSILILKDIGCLAVNQHSPVRGQLRKRLLKSLLDVTRNLCALPFALEDAC